MRYPEFKDAKCTITNTSVGNKANRFGIIFLSVLALLMAFGLISSFTYFLFFFVIPKSDDNAYLNVISVGASLVTFSSAVISILSLFDSNCLRKYNNDLVLFERRYLNGLKISGWDFLYRCSYKKSEMDYNYYITSAKCVLYSGNKPQEMLEVIIPALAVDFNDLNCLVRIIQLKKFIPSFLQYIYSELEKSSIEPTDNKKSPIYFITVPYHIIAMYKRILLHKFFVIMLIANFLSIVSTVAVTLFIILINV